MKTLLNRISVIPVLIIALFLCSFKASESFAGPVKYALIIAVGNYPASTGWPVISSGNDVPLIKGSLEKQGFEDKNIFLLQDSFATKEGIMKAFTELEAKLQPGDMVVIHYSGHGQQIFDDNGDELDGYDEAIIPYGAPSRYYKGYTGQKHLRDDELGAVVNIMRAKVGGKGQVIVFLDACHSGTGTRGAAKVRGGVPPLAPPDYEVPAGKQSRGAGEEGFGLAKNVSKTRGSNDDLAPFVLFSGASADELNYETTDENGNGVGSLSYAISKAFSTTDQNVTYRAIFANILATMAVVAPRQTPMLEGDIDYKVFNGQTVKQEPYYSVTETNSDEEIQIDGGNLNGLFKDDQVAIYPAGTVSIKNAQSLASGTLTSADNFHSVVKLDKPYKIENKKACWVFVTKQNFNNQKVAVQIENFKNKEFENQIRAALEGLNLVKLTNKNAELLIKESNQNRGEYAISIYEIADGNEIKSIPVVSDVDLSKVTDQVKNFAQAKFLREIKLDDPKHKIVIELLPATLINGKYCVKVTDTSVKKVVPAFKVGDTLLIKVTNMGTEAAYFNILDIQPDGIINALIPRKGIDGKEYKLEAGASKLLLEKPLRLSPPTGTEIFKVFATSEPINFTQIIGTRGEKKGSGHPLELLLQNSYQTRGADDISLSGEDPGTTFEYTFKILTK